MKDLIKNTIRSLSKNDFVVLSFVISSFLSVYLLAVFIILLPFYAIFTKQTKLFLPKDKNCYLLLLFSLFACLSSFLFSETGYLNGFVLETRYVKLLSVGIVLLTFDIFFFVNIINRKSFRLSLICSSVMSVFSVLVGSVQMALKIYPDPINRPGRVASVFMNENFFGMMLEFTILITLFLFFESKKKKQKAFFAFVFFVNLVGLWLCQCRMAFLVAALSVFLFLFFHARRVSYCVLGFIGLLGLGLLIKPDLLPRFDSILSTFDFRFGIWKNAWEGFLKTPLLGRGYYAYCAVWTHSSNTLYSALHAHSLYLEMLLNFGVVGTSLLALFSCHRAGKCLAFCKTRNAKAEFSLVLGTCLAILIHSAVDITLFWPQTGFLAVLLLVSPHLYEKGESI